MEIIYTIDVVIATDTYFLPHFSMFTSRPVTDSRQETVRPSLVEYLLLFIPVAFLLGLLLQPVIQHVF
jgi:hypothetical protein